MARGWFGSTNSVTGGGGRTLYGNGPSGVSNPVQTVASPSTTTTPVIGGVSTIVTTAATGTAMTNGPAGFARRQSNSWNYHSPSWSGFTVNASYSADNESSGRPETSLLDPRLFSLGGAFRSGPLVIGLAYEQHNDYNPGNNTQGTALGQYAGGSDDNWTLVAGYTFAGFNVRGMYSQTTYETQVGGDLKVKGFGLFADWAIMGPHTLRAQYVQTDDTSGSSTINASPYIGPLRGNVCGATSNVSCAGSTGSQLWSLVYSYAFSKRTEGSIVYTKLDNDSNAAFSLGKTSAIAGTSQSSAGVAVKHRF
jgi:predicted porin